jgi:hypothetical protein
MVGASFTVAAAAQVLRSKKGISAVGNAQVDTAQSNFGGASALFDGTGDYLIVDNIAGGITEDQTFEFWIRFADLPASSGYRMVAGDGSSTRYLGLFNDSGTYRWEVSFASGQYVERFTTSVSTGVWYHVALTKSAATLKMYQAGTALTSAVSFNTMTAAKTLFTSGTNYIGSWNTSSNFFNGHMDEIRVSNNVRYTTTFTPSTTPFVNDANTVFLMHANGTDASTFFEDDNGVRSSTSLIATGAAKVSTTQSKFGGSSANFDGSSNTQVLVRSWDTSSYTGDFTIEGWFYITDKTTSSNARVWSDGDGSTTEDFRLLQFEYSTNQIYMVTGQSGNDSWNYSYVSATLNINTWYHIAASRSGSSLRIFVNGTQQGSTISNSLAFTSASSNHSGRLGMFRTDASRYRGFIDDFRISNSARYTTTFTPSTTPFVNDSNTLLLIDADGTNNSTVFRDDNGARAQQGIQVNGNAQTDTAISKFGGSSLLLDGTGDAIQCSDNAMRFNASADRTIEFWIYSDRNNTTEVFLFQGVNTGSTMDYWQWYFTSTNVVLNIPGSSPVDAAITRSTGTWYHFAWVKQGNSNAVYWNGTSVATFTKTDSDWGLTDNNTLFIGYQEGGTTAFDGNIDEFRISSSARYTANFTPSTTPFQSDANTVLLLHMDGTDGSTVFFDDNGIAPYTP